MRYKLSGFTLIELLIIVVIIAMIGAMTVPCFLEAQERAKVSRAKADMRSVATALQTYHRDHEAFPPNAVAFVLPLQLTTPVAYINSLPRDPFEEFDGRGPKRETLGYYSLGDSWALFSRGPDQTLQINPRQYLTWQKSMVGGFVAPEARTERDEKTQTAIEYIRENAGAQHNIVYDPTNGTISSGDVIRTNLGQL